MFHIAKICFVFFSLFTTSYSEGTQVFDWESQQCCQGVIHDFPQADGDHYNMCCGTSIYKLTPFPSPSESKSICFQGELFPEVNGTAKCCGLKVFEPATHACHSWNEGETFKLVPLSPKNNKDGDTMVCGRTENEIKHYNPIVEVCCFGVLHEIKDGMKCCGQSYIESAISECCEEWVVDRQTMHAKVINRTVAYYNGVDPDDATCCGGVIMDGKTQKCCDGVVVDFPQNSSNSYLFYCCGTHLVTDDDTQFCVEEDHLVARENRNQVPCGGTLHQISGNDPFNVYCIDGQLKTSKKNEFLCPVNGKYTPFDRKEQVCGDNELIDKEGDQVGKVYTFICSNSTTNDTKLRNNKLLVNLLRKYHVTPYFEYEPHAHSARNVYK